MKNNIYIVQGTQKWHWNFSIGQTVFLVIDQNNQNFVLIHY